MQEQPGVETCTSIARMLDGIATEAKQLLEGVSSRFKVNLKSPNGWLDLQAALLSDKLSGRISDESRRRLTRDCVRWLHLYRQLDFAASTRPVWNS